MKKIMKKALKTLIILSLATLICWFFSPKTLTTSLFWIIIGCVFVFEVGKEMLIEKLVRPRTTMQTEVTTITTAATVFSKTINQIKNKSKYCIAFVLPDGTQKSIPMKGKQYDAIVENEEGKLTYGEYYKYIWLVKFQHQA